MGITAAPAFVAHVEALAPDALAPQTAAPQRARTRSARELLRDGASLLTGIGAGAGTWDETSLRDRGLVHLDAQLAARADCLAGQLVSDGARPLRPREAIAHLTRVQDLRLEIAEQRTRQLISRQRGVTAALRELRHVTTLDQTFKRAPAMLCDCGFSRAWISVVDRDTWRPTQVHPPTGRPLHHLTESNPPTVLRGTPEFEVLRRRRSLLVPDARACAAVDPLISETLRSQSYVIAPLLVQTQVVAFIHADRPDSAVPLDEDDLDTMRLFSEALSQTLQQVMLSERLEQIRADVTAAARSVEQMVEDRCSQSLTLSLPASGEGSCERGDAVGMRSAPGQASGRGSARLAELLTSRELEVLRLMAAGETNAGIARQLVISEGTVKSHVKNVLRKLRVANRSQAVARYFRVVRAEEPA